MIEPVKDKDVLIPSDSLQVPPSRLAHLDIPPPSYLSLCDATTPPIPPLQTLSRPVPLILQSQQVPLVVGFVAADVTVTPLAPSHLRRCRSRRVATEGYSPFKKRSVLLILETFLLQLNRKWYFLYLF